MVAVYVVKYTLWSNEKGSKVGCCIKKNIGLRLAFLALGYHFDNSWVIILVTQGGTTPINK
jgi:hypothetical protein